MHYFIRPLCTVLFLVIVVSGCKEDDSPAFWIKPDADSDVITPDSYAESEVILVHNIPADCKSCMSVAEMLLERSESLEDIQIVLITPYPSTELDRLKLLIKERNIKNAVAGFDVAVSDPRALRHSEAQRTRFYVRDGKSAKGHHTGSIENLYTLIP